MLDDWDNVNSDSFYMGSGAGVIDNGDNITYSIYNPAGGQSTAFNNQIPKPGIVPIKPIMAKEPVK